VRCLSGFQVALRHVDMSAMIHQMNRLGVARRVNDPEAFVAGDDHGEFSRRKGFEVPCAGGTPCEHQPVCQPGRATSGGARVGVFAAPAARDVSEVC